MAGRQPRARSFEGATASLTEGKKPPILRVAGPCGAEKRRKVAPRSVSRRFVFALLASLFCGLAHAQSVLDQAKKLMNDGKAQEASKPC